MWPWEHLIFGYVWYSVLHRVAWGQPISDAEGLALALATQAPDLVDKTLSWTLGVVSWGYGPAHSVLVGLPAAALVAGALWTRDRARVATAFLLAYGSHLVGDALALRANGPNLGRLLWPVVTFDAYETRLGFVERFATYFGSFAAQMTDPENFALISAYGAVFACVAVLWVLDGTPGIRRVRRLVDADR
jgi:membrane-bound metal-dependent hydrolase YbcI (DUF457 family)